MEFSYEYTIIENTENIPLNLEPKQNALFQALRVHFMTCYKNKTHEYHYKLSTGTKFVCQKKKFKLDGQCDKYVTVTLVISMNV